MIEIHRNGEVAMKRLFISIESIQVKAVCVKRPLANEMALSQKLLASKIRI